MTKRDETFLERLRLRLLIGLDWTGRLSTHLIVLRIPLALIAAGMFLTFRVDQISELFFLMGNSHEGRVLDVSLSLLVSLLFGLTIWYCSRVLFRFRFKARPALADAGFSCFRDWAPRVLGAIVPALMAIGCAMQLLASHNPDEKDIVRLGMMIAGFGLEAFLILFVSTKRRKWLRKWERIHSPSNLVPRHPNKEAVVTGIADLGSGRFVFYGGIALNILVFIAAWWLPEALAVIGSIALIELTALLLTISGTWVITYTENSAVPVISILLVLVLALEALHLNNNHHVRQTFGQESYTTAHPSIDAKRLPSGPEALKRRLDTIGEGPVFMVSSEGGGIKAAAWTVLVLARLDFITHGRFGDRLVAASGVSGGSLGIATYVAMRRLLREGQLELSAFQCGADDNRCPAFRFLTRDYLRPVLANMLVVDQAQRLIPWPIFPDRGTTLERAWEHTWSEVALPAHHDQSYESTHNAFAMGWSRDELIGFEPWLLLNTTVVSTGQRLIEQPYGFNATDFLDCFPDADDGADLLAATAPLSAVVHNSARFTFVSPAGLLDAPEGEAEVRQVVDGGYFENSGAATLLGAYRMITGACGKARVVDASRVYVIHISNDPGVPPMLPDNGDACDTLPALLPPDQTGEITSPLVALLNTREARGDLSRRAMVREVEKQAEDHTMHFRLCEGMHHLPLGWTLSAASWGEMTHQLGDPTHDTVTMNVQKNLDQLTAICKLAAGVPGCPVANQE